MLVTYGEEPTMSTGSFTYSHVRTLIVRKTKTPSQASRCLGVVSGAVLKLARQSTASTQDQLAEGLDIDVSTVQGWESGRRPLTAVRTSDLARVRMYLAQHGARPSLIRSLWTALEADLIIGTGVQAGTSWDRGAHPLASTVYRHAMLNMVTWPITGHVPAGVDVAADVPRRSAAFYPRLSPEERTRLFDHLRVVAERARGEEMALLRRQAVYLLGFDRREGTAAWLQQEWLRATRRPRGGLAGLLDSRSAAVARASFGDASALHEFVRSIRTEGAESANLNYWSHWIGELPDEQHDDNFMLDTDPRSWAGLRLARHLTTRITPGTPHLALNLHTLHALVGSRLSLLTAFPQLRQQIEVALERLTSIEGSVGHMRDEVTGLIYAVRSVNR